MKSMAVRTRLAVEDESVRVGKFDGEAMLMSMRRGHRRWLQRLQIVDHVDARQVVVLAVPGARTAAVFDQCMRRLLQLHVTVATDLFPHRQATVVRSSSVDILKRNPDKFRCKEMLCFTFFFFSL